MPTEPDELKVRLLKEAAVVIEAMLAEKRPAGQNSLSEQERRVVRGGQAFEERVIQALAEEESEAESQPVCESYGVGMRSRGKRKRAVVTEGGRWGCNGGIMSVPSVDGRLSPWMNGGDWERVCTAQASPKGGC